MASIGLCGIEISFDTQLHTGEYAPQSDCVELKFAFLRVVGPATRGPQSDYVELKWNRSHRVSCAHRGLNRTVWN